MFDCHELKALEKVSFVNILLELGDHSKPYHRQIYGRGRGLPTYLK